MAPRNDAMRALRPLAVVAALAVAAMTVAAASAAATASPVASVGTIQAIVRTPDGLVDQRYAIARGCSGNFDKLLTGKHWADVDGNTPVVAEGMLYALGTDLGSRVAHHDTPFDHDSHDWNGELALDPAYKGLLSNHTDGLISGVTGGRLLELEWEIDDFPKEFWPIEGDRVRAMGRWIFDCGHHDKGYKTEIHPAEMIAATRREAIIFSGDGAPSIANVTRMFVNGQGGYYNARAGGKDYTVDIPVPPKPSPGAVLRYETTGQIFLGIPGPYWTPTLTPIPATNPTAIRFTLPYASTPASTTFKRAAVAAVGWSEPVLTQAYRRYPVQLLKVKILHDHDSGAAEWRLWVLVGHQWLKIDGLNDVDDGDTVLIGKVIHALVPVRYDPNQPTVPIPTIRINLQATGWENDCDSSFGGGLIVATQCLANDNDAIGKIRGFVNTKIPAALDSYGTVTSSTGDYQVIYRFLRSGGLDYPVGLAQ